MARSILRFAGMLLLFILAGTAPLFAAERVALVIGNGIYQKVPTLPNPPHDAADIGKALERLNFRVTQLSNATAAEMRKAIVDFGRSTEGAEMAVIFYAGHGMEVSGENWLIPTDAELRSDTDVESEAISLRSINLQVSKARQLGLVILDACRNNPFAAKMKRSISTRAVARGLAPTEPSDNVLIAYAARDGTTASDGDSRNSPFTTALLRHIETPGVEISFLFRRVRDDVMATTKREQQPFVYGSLSKEEIYLRAPSATSSATRLPAEKNAAVSASADYRPRVNIDDAKDAVTSGASLLAARVHNAQISTNFYFSSFRIRPEPQLKHSSFKLNLVVYPSGKIEETYQEVGPFAKTGTSASLLGARYQLLDENTLQRTRHFKDHVQTLTIAISGERCRATITNELKPGFVEWEGRSTELGQQAFYKDWVMTSSTCIIK